MAVFLPAESANPLVVAAMYAGETQPNNRQALNSYSKTWSEEHHFWFGPSLLPFIFNSASNLSNIHDIFTLHVIIIPAGTNVRKSIGTPGAAEKEIEHF